MSEYNGFSYTKEYHKQYYQKNKERHKELGRLWRLKNVDKWREYSLKSVKKYQKNHPELRRMQNKAQHAMVYYPGKLTTSMVQSVYEDNIKKFGSLTCYLCLMPVKFGEDALEHKIPATKGGTNDYSNLAIAHISCNNKKQFKTLGEYRKWLKESV